MRLRFFKNGLFMLCFTNSLVSAKIQSPKTELVNIANVNPKIQIEVIYATDKNFTGQAIYELPKCYLRQEVACALNEVQKKLEQMKSKKHPNGLGIKIWDGYRPMDAQKKMWDACAKQYPDEKEREHYVSNPTKEGGRHTRATSVDVTVVDLKTGKPLEMGTDFDDFSPRAWRTYADLPKEIKSNRKLLEDVMAKHGFAGIKSEWWHFDYQGWQSYEPLNISFAQLAAQN